MIPCCRIFSLSFRTDNSACTFLQLQPQCSPFLSFYLFFTMRRQQTSTADMLDLAVDHIRGLQNELQVYVRINTFFSFIRCCSCIYTHSAFCRVSLMSCTYIYHAPAGSQERQGEVQLPRQSSSGEITHVRRLKTMGSRQHIIERHCRHCCQTAASEGGCCGILASADRSRYFIFVKNLVF